MPHPKRRTSKARQGLRRSHLALATRLPNHCPRCGSATRPHRVCDTCGHYGFAKGGQKGVELLEKEEF